MAHLALLCLLACPPTIFAGAVLELSTEPEIKGTWRASVILPCTYEPSGYFEEQSIVWKRGTGAFFHRDRGSGDQTLLTAYKGRITVSKESPGDASLQIQDLDMSDKGLYTCEITWEARNKSRVTRSATTTLRVEKVPVTKPELMPSHLGSALPRGSKIQLTCSAQGSPPIQYRWFKEGPGISPKRVAEKATLAFDNLQESDTGTYYCEVENRGGAQAVRQSDAVQLTVEGSVETPQNRNSSVQQGPRKANLPLYVIVLLAVLGAALLAAVVSVTLCRRRSKNTHNYSITYNAANITNGERPPGSPGVPCSQGAPCSPGGAPGTYGCEYEDPNSCAGNIYHPQPTKDKDYAAMDMKADNEYEYLVNKMESEYEAIDSK